LREATGKYHNVTKALQDGYVAPARRDGSLNCVYNPRENGGMGYHFVHRQDVLEGSPFEVGVGGDPLKPEAMLYETKKDGELTLVAVEWIVQYDRWTGQPDTQPLLVLGDGNLVEPFHGPMAGHEYWAGSPFLEGPNGEAWMPWHYDLHAWIWKDNSRGVFHDWNPDVSCP